LSPIAGAVLNQPDTLLLTRSEAQNKRLGAALAAQDAGASVTIKERPLLEVRAEPLDLGSRQRVLGLDQYDHLIFISQNAVAFGLPQLADFWPQWPLDLRWYGVGPATGELLAQAGIDCHLPLDYSSEGLLALPELASVRGQKVLIVRGLEGGRETLREQLMGRGATVDYLPVYRRIWRPYPDGFWHDLERSRLRLAVVYSGASLARLVQLAGAPVTAVALIVPSERILTLAMQLGFAKVQIARPDDESMVASILAFWQSPGSPG
jgi:uroporphyrinogen-III synthase